MKKIMATISILAFIFVLSGCESNSPVAPTNIDDTQSSVGSMQEMSVAKADTTPKGGEHPKPVKKMTIGAVKAMYR